MNQPDDAPPPPAAPAPATQRPLLLLLLVVTLAFGWILKPFFGAVMWGAIIALLFTPIYRHLLPRLRRQRTLAALVTLLLVLLAVVLPLVLIAASLVRQSAAIVQRVQSGEIQPMAYLQRLFDALPGWMHDLLNRFELDEFADLQRRITEALAQGSQFLATQALGVGQITFDFLIQLAVALYLAFFLLRDGDGIARLVRDALPLDPAHKRELLAKFATVIRATVKGNLLVAMVQGALGGFAFWVLGISGALLWAVVMAFLSLLPAVGAGLVWVPVAIYLLVTGAVWQGIALAVYGVVVIGLVDNVLRPLLVGKDTRMPDYIVLISTLGGMAVMGINGFVVGPTIAAMFIAVWAIYAKAR